MNTHGFLSGYMGKEAGPNVVDKLVKALFQNKVPPEAYKSPLRDWGKKSVPIEKVPTGRKVWVGDGKANATWRDIPLSDNLDHDLLRIRREGLIPSESSVHYTYD